MLFGIWNSEVLVRYQGSPALHPSPGGKKILPRSLKDGSLDLITLLYYMSHK